MNAKEKTKAGGNLDARRLDLQLIAAMIPHDTKVLDIGCGNGELLELLTQQNGVDARGLELERSGVNACVARGLAVVQGDADTDLSYYPDKGFDTVILSQTLQATHAPLAVLKEMSRIGSRLIVSIPNFGHWKLRLQLLLKGQMPKTNTLAAEWYETANIHLCTIKDFTELCAALNLSVEQSIIFSGNKVRNYNGAPPARENFLAEQAVFTLSSATPAINKGEQS